MIKTLKIILYFLWWVVAFGLLGASIIIWWRAPNLLMQTQTIFRLGVLSGAIGFAWILIIIQTIISTIAAISKNLPFYEDGLTKEPRELLGKQ